MGRDTLNKGEDPIEFTIDEFITRTDGAVRLKLVGHKELVWLPVSKIEEETDDLNAGDVITIPQWLAADRDLL